MSLRVRLWLSFAPLLLLLTGLGVTAIVSLGRIGDRIDVILRQNYRSVEAMNGLAESLSRIDASFLLRLTDRPEADKQFADAWAAYDRHLIVQHGNITEPGEAELVARLAVLTDGYHKLGEQFFHKKRTAGELTKDYHGPGEGNENLISKRIELRRTIDDIRQLNQERMGQSSEAARHSAAVARWWAGLGLFAALVATFGLAWRTTNAVLRPVEDLTRSAKAVGDGRFDQIVTAETRDEIADLVSAFNRMTSQLRDLRQTDAARLLRARHASQAALDAFPDPILVLDPAGRVEMANPAANRVLGVIPSADGTERVWSPPDRLREPLRAALADQQPYRPTSFATALTYRAADEERFFLPTILPVSDPCGNSLGAAVVLNDVTRFRLLDEFKGDLVATASHELKTPLAGLRLAVHVLLEEVVGPLTPKQMELLIDARDNTERLVRIVDHLLALARLETGREPLNVRPVFTASLLTTAAERMRPLLNGRTLMIDNASPDITIEVDPDRIGRALDNLLTNALAYTGPQGTVTLSARPTSPNEIELAVRDTGVGIPPEHVPHVFDKFFRVPGQNEPGTGLGLAIVKEVASAHGGRVACESEPGVGTTFRLVVPIQSRGSK